MTNAGGRQTQSTDQRALRAIAVQFFVNGALFAAFIPRLPEIRDRVDISVADIGLLMSAAGASGLLASALVGRAIERFGTRLVMLASGTMVCISLAIVGLSTTWAVLLVGLAGMMLFDVPVDVAMNLQGSWLSGRRPTPIMNRLHGLWSLGTAAGGILSSRIAAAGVSVTTHLLLTATMLFVVLLYVSAGVLRDDEAASPDPSTASTHRRFSPVLVLFVLAGLFAVAVESTTIDWAAFRFSDDYGVGAGAAALAYVAVTTGMTVGRFAGDTVLGRIGADRLTAVSILLASSGIAVAALATGRAINLVGFVIAGLGIATLLPGLYDAAAKLPGRSGAGLGALTAGIRTSVLTVPLTVGALAGTDLAVGDAMAIVTLPALVGFAFVTVAIRRR